MNLRTIKVVEAKPSETNVKGRDRGPAFEELVASVKEKGVLSPVLVRPISAKDAKWEVVAGNRRLAAARKAGLEEIPAVVREMTDIEAREAQIVENLQRENIHPLDEGEAYRALIEESGYEIKAVAAKVGKSERYVRSRLVLTNLIAKAAKAFREDAIHAGHAELISRLDHKDQEQALEYVLDGDADMDDLRRWIQRSTFAALAANPPWTGDEIAAALEDCEECPQKGVNLFGDKAPGTRFATRGNSRRTSRRRRPRSRRRGRRWSR
jgi:ParB family transcriptional regulator, chromosome partitioning protein